MILSVVIFIGAVVAAIAGYSYWSDRPRLQTEFWKLKVGDTREDVIFKKGQPIQIHKNKDREILVYQERSNHYVVLMSDDRVGYVIVDSCYEKDKKFSESSLQGINTWSSSDDIIKKFGEPQQKDHLNISGGRRIYNYPKHGLSFSLVKDQVCAMGLVDPKGRGVQIFN